jgi:hypothetical protein
MERGGAGIRFSGMLHCIAVGMIDPQVFTEILRTSRLKCRGA